jgi:UDP-N-acetylglucosamine 2-epimerase
MPEEINRLVTDHVSTLLFCPTKTAVKNLVREGITKGVHLVGDVMYDALRHNIQIAERRPTILEQLKLRPKEYALATVHRAENTDQPENLNSIVNAFIELAKLGQTVVFPVHPRTRKRLNTASKDGSSSLLMVDPVSYLDMLMLEKHAKVILTDSGGVQKEAYWLHVPCITLRNETEWVETVASRWNVLVGTDTEKIFRATQDVSLVPYHSSGAIYEKEGAAGKIANTLIR